MEMLRVLTFVILSILSNGQPELSTPKSEARFGWGLSYNYIGQVYHGLNTYELAVSVELPDFNHLPIYTPISEDMDFCSNWKNFKSFSSPFGNRYRLPAARQVCNNIWPAYLTAVKDVKLLEGHIQYLVDNEIPAILPRDNGPLRGKNSTNCLIRHKRWIASLIGIGIKGISSLFSHFAQKRREAAMSQIQQDVVKNIRRIKHIKSVMMSIARGTMREVTSLYEQLKTQGARLNNLTSEISKLGDRVSVVERETKENTQAILLASKLLTMVASDISHYKFLYEQILTEIDHILVAVDLLSQGHLSHTLIAPSLLLDMIVSVKSELLTNYPGYELVTDSVDEVYDLPVHKYERMHGMLIVYVPLYVKPSLQEPLNLFQVESIPVPYHLNPEMITVDENVNAYTYVPLTSNLLGMSTDTYIAIDEKQLANCVKFRQIHLCAKTFLIKHHSEHTCESAIYHRVDISIIKEKCNIQYFPNLNPDPAILDAEDYFILGNLPGPWHVYCSENDQLPNQIESSKYVVMKKSDLCRCSLAAGTWYLQENIMFCTERVDTKVSLFYSLNMAVMVYLYPQSLVVENISDTSLSLEPFPYDGKDPTLIEPKLPEGTNILSTEMEFVGLKEIIENLDEKAFMDMDDYSIYIKDPVNWFDGVNIFGFMFVGCILAVLLVPVIVFIAVKFCGFKLKLHKVNKSLGGLLALQLVNEQIQSSDALCINTQDKVTLESVSWKVIMSFMILSWIGLLLGFLTVKVVVWLSKFLYAIVDKRELSFVNLRMPGYVACLADHIGVYLQLIAVDDNNRILPVNLYLGHYTGCIFDLRLFGSMSRSQLTLEKHWLHDSINIDWQNTKIYGNFLELSKPPIKIVPLTAKFQTRLFFKYSYSYFRIMARNYKSGETRILAKSKEFDYISDRMTNMSTFFDVDMPENEHDNENDEQRDSLSQSID